MAALQFLQLKTAVSGIVGDDASIGRHLNTALLKLAALSQKTKTAVLNVTDGGFSLPADCLIPRALYWEGYLLKRYSGDVLPDLGSGDPLYYLFGTAAGSVAPRATGTATLVYTPRPVEMVNDTDLPAFADCDDALIAYAVWQLYVQSEDDEEAKWWEEKWLKEMAAWLDLDAKQNRRPRRVNVQTWA